MTRTIAVLLALLAGAAAGAQERRQAHMEGCLIWSRQDAVGVRNECSRPITLQFMNLEDQKVVTTELPPGGRFVSELRWGQVGGFIFTACAPGLKPSVAFDLENKEAIGLSLYNCVGGQPTS